MSSRDLRSFAAWRLFSLSKKFHEVQRGDVSKSGANGCIGLRRETRTPRVVRAYRRWNRGPFLRFDAQFLPVRLKLRLAFGRFLFIIGPDLLVVGNGLPGREIRFARRNRRRIVIWERHGSHGVAPRSRTTRPTLAAPPSCHFARSFWLCRVCLYRSASRADRSATVGHCRRADQKQSL